MRLTYRLEYRTTPSGNWKLWGGYKDKRDAEYLIARCAPSDYLTFRIVEKVY